MATTVADEKKTRLPPLTARDAINGLVAKWASDLPLADFKTLEEEQTHLRTLSVATECLGRPKPQQNLVRIAADSPKFL